MSLRNVVSIPLPAAASGAADAAALFSHLRSNFGNSAAPVDAATVAQALRQ